MTTKSVSRQRVVYDQRLNQKNDIYYESYQLGKQLGKGGFAHVFEVFKTNEISPNLKAVKVLSLKDISGHNKEKIQNEIKLMQLASSDSENFVKYYHSFSYADKFYIIMELCELGSMNDVFKKRKLLTEPEVRYFMQQLVEILLQLKKKGIVHRDIKPANILISSNFKFKLADFGLAILHTQISKVKTMCGTPNYLAPQVITKKGYSYEVDLWAMGVMMFTVLYGVAPFQTKHLNQTYQKIKRGSFKFEGPTKAVRVSQEAKSLIKDILKIQPNQRIKLQEIPMHPFFCSYQIPRKLEREFIQVPPPLDFVRKYMKKIVVKNERKPIQFSQNNSETRLQKKQNPSPKVTYRNCLSKQNQREKSTIEYKATQSKVKVEQFIDLQLSKVQTSTSLKKRTRNSVGCNPTPRKIFRNNNYVKNEIKIEDSEKMPRINEIKREQSQVIVKKQDIVKQKNKTEEPSLFFKLKSFYSNTNLPHLLRYEENTRSQSNYIRIQQQYPFQKKIKQQQKRFIKANYDRIIWQKIMQNGDCLYGLSNELYGALFKDNKHAITRDFSYVKLKENEHQYENNLIDKIKLDSKISLLRFYQKQFPLRSKIKMQLLGIDEPVNCLLAFAEISVGILQFRHKQGWILTYIREERQFFYQESLQAEHMCLNLDNLCLYHDQISSRFFEFMEAIQDVLSEKLWTCNGWETKDEQIKAMVTHTRELECRAFQRLFV